jgi:hypothetical protein
MTSIPPVTAHTLPPLMDESPFTMMDLQAHAAQSKPRIELLLIQENADLKKLGDDFMMAMVKQLKRENLAVKLGLQEQLTNLEAQAKASSSQSSWHFLSKIATSVLSLFGIVAGTQLIATAGGGYLIASGVASLAHTLITHCNGWNWVAETLASENEEAKARIRTLMPLTLTLMSFALGMNGAQLAGGDAQAILQNLQRLKAYTFGAVEGGNAYNTYQQGKIDTQVINTERVLIGHDKKVAALTRELKNWLDLFRQISSYSKQSVKQAIRETNAVASRG